MATINTTTINGVPEVETELTGDENILIQQAPNSNIMGKRTLNNLKSFLGASNTSNQLETVSNITQDNSILYISNSEFAKERELKCNNDAMYYTEITTDTYEPKKQEQLYIHASITENGQSIKNAANTSIQPNNSYIEIQTQMLTNSNGELKWFTICKSPLIFQTATNFYGNVHTHILLDAGVKIRARVYIGEGNSLTKGDNFYFQCDVTVMSNFAFGEYDSTKNIHSTLNYENRKQTYDVSPGKSSYVIDLYAKGISKTALNLSAQIQIDSQKTKGYQVVGKSIPYAASKNVSQRIGCYIFNEPISVNFSTSINNSNNGSYLEVNYKCDDNNLPTIEKMNTDVLSNSNSMIMDTINITQIGGCTLNNTSEFYVVREQKDGSKLYMIMDNSIAVDNTMGEKRFYISDDIREFKYYINDTLSKNLRTIKLNKSIKKLQESCFYRCTELEEIDMINSELEIIDKNAFDMYSLKNLHLTKIVCPMSLKTIGANAFRNISNLSLFSIPYTFESIDNTCLAGSPIIAKEDWGITYQKLHIRIKRDETLYNGNVSKTMIETRLLTEENKEKFFKLRSINTFNPTNTDLRLLICDENDIPLTVINDMGGENLLSLNIPVVKTNQFLVTEFIK